MREHGRARSEPEPAAETVTQTHGPEAGTAPAETPGLELPVGSHVGPFRLERLLGQGGMGAVYLATDERLERQVAIKFHQECNTLAFTRFEREAKILAKLSHRNIVAVHEVGIHRGRLYLAMEYIDGGTLRQWLAGAERSWQEIVALFRQVGEGLAAAHDAGLVHRDFKLDNVLVGSNGRVCVADFGIAQLAPERDGDTPPGAGGFELTTPSGDIVGTLRYMAPEQLRGQDVTAAADQFSFCVCLFEAVYGERPFEGGDVDSLLRAIAAVDRVIPGSKRRIPSRIHRAIVKGLSADPGDRHENMSVLLAALAPPRSRRKQVIVTALFAAATAALVLASVRDKDSAAVCGGAETALADQWGPSQAEAIQRAFRATGASYAPGLASRLTARLDDYASEWRSMYETACKATRVTKEQSAELLDLRMSCLSRRQLQLGAVARNLGAIDNKSLMSADKLVVQLEPISDCAATDRLMFESSSGLALERSPYAEELRQRLAEVRLMAVRGQHELAERGTREILGHARALGYGQRLAEATYELSQLARERGRIDEAIELAYEAAALANKSGQRRLLAKTWGRLVHWHGFEKRQTNRALTLARVAQTSLAGLPGAANEQGILEDAIAAVYFRKHDYASARTHLQRSLELLRVAFGPDHPNVAGAQNNLGIVARRLGNLPQARDYLRSALASKSKHLSADHPRLAATHVNLANVLMGLGEYEDAEEQARRALAIRRAIYPENHPLVARAMTSLALALGNQYRWKEALRLCVRVHAILSRIHDHNHPAVAQSLRHLAQAHAQLGEHARAVQELETSLAIHTRAPRSRPAEVCSVRIDLAASLAALGRKAEALQQLEKGVELGRRAYHDRHPEWAPLLLNAASAYVMAGDARQGLSLAQQAYEVAERARVPLIRAEALFLIARTRSPAAPELARKAKALLEAMSRPPRHQLEQINRWLGELKPPK